MIQKIIRDADGNLLFTRIIARIAEICDECTAAIWPGDSMVVYDDIASHDGRDGSPLHIKRHYCDACGKLLEDSLTTTEAVL
jgi:RNase P subunit RPR2